MATAPFIKAVPIPNMLQTLVDAIAGKSSQEAALFEIDLLSEGNFSLLYTTADFPRSDLGTLSRQLKNTVFTENQPVNISGLVHLSPPFQSGQVIPLHGEDSFVGVLVVVSTTAAINEDDFLESVATDLTLLSMSLENRYLRKISSFNHDSAQAILNTAEAAAGLPSAQKILEMLRDYLFAPEISGCAILLYGPLDEAEPDAPYEYLEISGVWTRKRGSGGGIGIRLGIEDYRKRLALLESRKFYVFQEMSDRVRQIFDPLVRGLLRAADIQSMTIISLQTAGKALGLLVLTSNRPHYFSTFEIYGYRVAAEYLALSAFASSMMQQRDRVQQVRRAMLDAVSDAVLLVQPGAQGGRVISNNAVFTNLFDLSETSMHGKTLDDVLAQMTLPEDVRTALTPQWVNMPVRSSDTRSGEFRVVHSSGQTLEILWKSTPVYQDGQVQGRVYAFHDATADRTSARLRAEFLSRISHELRTPLTSIQGFAEFILEAGGDDLPAMVREYTQIILSSAKHLKTIISDIIDITRLDAGQIQLTREVSSLSDTIKEAVASMEPHYRRRSQRVVLKLDTHLPSVNIDRTRIKQVLSNLISNAVKYAPESSEVQIHAKYVASMEDLPEGSPSNIVLPAILVTISDEGKGVSADDADKVFMPFFRTEQARRDRTEGVGLGLTVVRSLVEVHQGNIWLTPCPPAAGGCFMFTLPVVRETEPM